jgi:hypothetical protein
MRRILLTVTNLVALVVIAPTVVLVAAWIGAEPRHISGIRITGVDMPNEHYTPPPGPASALLDAAMQQDPTAPEALGPSWYDGKTGEVVLAAVTPYGEGLRRTIGAAADGVRWRISLVQHSVGTLTRATADIVTTAQLGVFMAYVDPVRDQVMAETDAFGKDFFGRVRDRYGDLVGVVYAQPRPILTLLNHEFYLPAWWTSRHPFGTWLALTFGFPLYLGVLLLLDLGGWVALRWRRRPRGAAATMPADATPTVELPVIRLPVSDQAVPPLPVQRGITTAALDQYGRRPVLHDATALHDQYPVRDLHSGESMGDHDGRTLGEDGPQRHLHEALRRDVEG